MGSRRLRDFFDSLSSEFENGTIIDHFESALPQFSEEGFLQDVLEFGLREFPHLVDFLGTESPSMLSIIEARFPQIMDIVAPKFQQTLVTLEERLPLLSSILNEKLGGGVKDMFEANIFELLGLIGERVPGLLSIVEETRFFLSNSIV